MIHLEMENPVLHGFPDEPEPEACLEKQRVNNARELWTEEGQARSQRESQVLYRTHAAADRIFSNSRFAPRICSYGIEGNLNNLSFCAGSQKENEQWSSVYVLPQSPPQYRGTPPNNILAQTNWNIPVRNFRLARLQIFLPLHIAYNCRDECEQE